MRFSEIDIWLIDLKQHQTKSCFSWLDLNEQDRARQFKTAEHFHRFVVSHAKMRLILSRYLHLSPSEVHFIQAHRQKPCLDANYHRVQLHFNLSHSNEMAILAVSQNCLVGIDVELIRPISDILQLASRFFSFQEHQILLHTPENKRLILFFKLWTAKEAFLKAKGLSIAGNLHRFSVRFDKQQNQTGIEEHKTHCPSWVLHRILINDDYESTLAVLAREKYQLVYKFESKKG